MIFLRCLVKLSRRLKKKNTDFWILKEKYKIENGEKVISNETGKGYMTAFNPDGKYVVDVRYLRDAEKEAEKKSHSTGIPIESSRLF